VFRQKFEETKFAGGQFDRTACAHRGPLQQVELEILDAQHRERCTARTPRQGFDARQHLFDGKGFAEVVIAACA